MSELRLERGHSLAQVRNIIEPPDIGPNRIDMSAELAAQRGKPLFQPLLNSLEATIYTVQRWSTLSKRWSMLPKR